MTEWERAGFRPPGDGVDRFFSEFEGREGCGDHALGDRSGFARSLRVSAWFLASFVATTPLALSHLGCAGATPETVREISRRGDTEALLRLWRECDRDDVRIAVLEAFGEHASKEAARRVLLSEARAEARALSPAPMRVAALRALSSVRDPEAVEVLIGALSDPLPEIRTMAKRDLAARGTEVLEALLIAVVTDPHPLTRATAARLLAGTSVHAGDLRVRVEDSLLTAAGNDSAAAVREAAASSLGYLGVSRATPLLVDLSKTDPDEAVRLVADGAARRLRVAASIPRPVVLVLPLKNGTGSNDPDIDQIVTQIPEYITARLAESGVCDVVDPAKRDLAIAELSKLGVSLYDGDAPNAPELGKFKLANQAIYGVLQRNGLEFALVLNRLDLSTLEIVDQGAVTVVGYRSDLHQMKVDATERMIGRFR